LSIAYIIQYDMEFIFAVCNKTGFFLVMGVQTLKTYNYGRQKFHS